jgi:hypothetical protein
MNMRTVVTFVRPRTLAGGAGAAGHVKVLVEMRGQQDHSLTQIEQADRPIRDQTLQTCNAVPDHLVAGKDERVCRQDASWALHVGLKDGRARFPFNPVDIRDRHASDSVDERDWQS